VHILLTYHSASEKGSGRVVALFLTGGCAPLVCHDSQGHNCTDYAKWFHSSQPYDVEYHDGYEPWFIIDRFRNPWYDVSFRGYGWNKVSHVLNIFYKK
jgi:hypothetical protein